MADKEKRSLREFLRHINDYTYRFNPEKGQFRYRELRGVRDTAFDFYMWLPYFFCHLLFFFMHFPPTDYPNYHENQQQ